MAFWNYVSSGVGCEELPVTPWNNAKPFPIFRWSKLSARFITFVSRIVEKSRSANEDCTGSLRALRNCRFRISSIGYISRNPWTAWNHRTKSSTNTVAVALRNSIPEIPPYGPA